MDIRLGFHYHVPAMHHNEYIIMPGYQGRFIDSLAQYCSQVICFLHSVPTHNLAILDYQITSANVSLVDIGLHASTPRRTLFAHRYTRTLGDRIADIDALLIRGPSPLLPAMAKVARNTPVVLLLVGDYLAGIDDSSQPRWRKEAIRLWATWNSWQQLHMARQSLTMVNSSKLYEQLTTKVPHLHEVRTTTLSKHDVFIHDDTCQGSPYHLLYVGRIDRTKGLLDIVEALAILVEQGEDVILNLVGGEQKGDTILSDIVMQGNRI